MIASPKKTVETIIEPPKIKPSAVIGNSLPASVPRIIIRTAKIKIKICLIFIIISP